VLVVLGLTATSIAGADSESSAPKFERSKYSQSVTSCDRLAAHPNDPDRVADGKEQAEIDLPAAIDACEAAVAADPVNPRLNYQLGRVLAYAGQGEKSKPYREVAVAANYPQAVFVVGFIRLFGLNAETQDTCGAAELIRRSAQLGRLAGELGFVSYSLAGRFENCPVKRDSDEMRGFLAAARTKIGGDFYQGLLIESLGRELDARVEKREAASSTNAPPSPAKGKVNH
jgi:hypothetical protein